MTDKTERDELVASQIEQGWRETFSTDNPFCPCDLKSFTKAVRWAERSLAAPAEGGQRYSDDRLSLAQEVRDTLKVRGHWTPDNWAGPDLITAVAMAVTQKSADGGQGEVVAGTVTGYLPVSRSVEIRLDESVPEWIEHLPQRAYLSGTTTFDAIGLSGAGHNADWCAGWNAHNLQSDLAAAIARAEALRAAGRRVTDAFRAHGKSKGLVADARTERECIAAMVALDEAIAAQQAEGE